MSAPLSLQKHADRALSVLVRTSDMDWIPAAVQGVSRKPIERDGVEPRCTTLVEFKPNKSFPEHEHTGGEEFFVTEGAWRDRWGVFPKYTYVRNYIGSKHSPLIGQEGVEILVRLRQMTTLRAEPDHKSWNCHPYESTGWESIEETPGEAMLRSRSRSPRRSAPDAVGKIKLLFATEFEKVFVEHYKNQKGKKFHFFVNPSHSIENVEPAEDGVAAGGGREVMVIEGAFRDELGDHDAKSWARYSKDKYGKHVIAEILTDELYLYVKEGHLFSDQVGPKDTPDE